METLRTCVGAGIYNLDTIFVKEGKEEKKVIEEVGGTCGNIVTILSWLGWNTYPIARLDNSPQGLEIKKGLKKYNADTRFVTNSEDGGTTILKIVHKKDKQGRNKTGISTSNPKGGRFPAYRFIRKERATEIVANLEFNPMVFFFDSPQAGHRILAEEWRKKGTLVYFEPSTIKDKSIQKCIAESDIIKFSDQNIPDAGFTGTFEDKLFIQTLGEKGLRFNLCNQGWTYMPPVYNDNVVDCEGAGDWTTAAFLDNLTKRGHINIRNLETEEVKIALHEAQQMASRSVSYLTPKGMIHQYGHEDVL